MDKAPIIMDPVRREDIVSTDSAVKHLQRRDVSAAQLPYSLLKYTGDPAETAAFGAFLERWPMYSEGPEHKETKHNIMACMASVRHLVPRLAMQFRDRLAGCPILRDHDLIALNDTWQSTVMGIDPADYSEFVPKLETVTSFFTTRSVSFNFLAANTAVNDLRHFVKGYPFSDGSLLAAGRAKDLHGDVLINLLADPRPSMLHCIRVLIHERGSGARERHDATSNRVIVEDLLRNQPPFGSIHRIVKTSDNRIEKAIRIDVQKCNAQIAKGLGLTFGSGRHICPAGNLISASLTELWAALVDVWPSRPVAYTWQGIPCVRSNPLRDQRIIFTSV